MSEWNKTFLLQQIKWMVLSRQLVWQRGRQITNKLVNEYNLHSHTQMDIPLASAILAWGVGQSTQWGSVITWRKSYVLDSLFTMSWYYHKCKTFSSSGVTSFWVQLYLIRKSMNVLENRSYKFFPYSSGTIQWAFGQKSSFNRKNTLLIVSKK